MSAGMEQAPSLRIEGRVATLRLNKPDYANRLSPADLDVLRAHIDTVNATEEVLVLRVVAGGKYFCSGYDISSLASEQAPSSLYFGEMVDMLEQCRPVTIAAIQGGVYGGGTDLCLACDFRLGTEDANMFMPAARLGLHFYPGGMRRYIGRLGLNNAKLLFLTGRRIEARQMFEIGFLTQLVGRDALHDETEALTEELAGMAPQALLGIKKHLNLIACGETRTAEIAEAVRRSEASSDIREGALAWKEKRIAVFTGS